MIVVSVLVLAALLLEATPGSAAGSAIPVPDSIDATGTRDVTDALNAFLAGVPDGATVEMPAGARYRVEGTLLVEGRDGLTIEGHGARLVARTDGAGATQPQTRGLRAHWPRLRSHVAIRRSSGVTVRDLIVRGPNRAGSYRPALEGQAGWVVARSSAVTLDGVRSARTFGDGVWITGSSRGVTVRDCRITRAGRQGVAITNASAVVVEDCELDAVARSAFDLEPVPAWTVSDVHLRRNRVGDYANLFVAAVGAGSGVTDVFVEDNTVIGGRGLAIAAGTGRADRQGFTVTGNQSSVRSPGLDGALMRFTRTSGLVVSGNTAAVEEGVLPLRLDASCGAEITRNRFPGAPDRTVRVTGCKRGEAATTRPGRRV